MTTEHDLVLVVDFGAQYAQLIARRVREARVYSEIVPHTMPIEEMLARNPKAIILSGGPSSVYEEGAPQVGPAVFEAGVPVFGMASAAWWLAEPLPAWKLGAAALVIGGLVLNLLAQKRGP